MRILSNSYLYIPFPVYSTISYHSQTWSIQWKDTTGVLCINRIRYDHNFLWQRKEKAWSVSRQSLQFSLPRKLHSCSNPTLQMINITTPMLHKFVMVSGEDITMVYTNIYSLPSLKRRLRAHASQQRCCTPAHPQGSLSSYKQYCMNDCLTCVSGCCIQFRFMPRKTQLISDILSCTGSFKLCSIWSYS